MEQPAEYVGGSVAPENLTDSPHNQALMELVERTLSWSSLFTGYNSVNDDTGSNPVSPYRLSPKSAVDWIL